MKKIIIAIIITLVLAVFATNAIATNWEIVSIVQNKKGFVMSLTDPKKIERDFDWELTKEEMSEITEYFSEQIRGIIGYQFIDDPSHTGIVRIICERKEGLSVKLGGK